jgi:hypothetical protein
MRALPPLAFLAACGTPDPADDAPPWADNFGVEETEGGEGCDNLLPDDCFYPYPSGAYLRDTPDGPRVTMPTEAMPSTRSGVYMSIEGLATIDGFGVASPVTFRLPGAALPDDLRVLDGSWGLDEASPTLLLDATTGARIPHWLEPDSLGGEDPAWVLRPAVPLPRDTDVVVGLRGFLTADGAPAEAPEPFRALRDQTASRWLGVHERRAHFEEVVFPTLEAAGVGREELQLAWSFHVRPASSATAGLLAVREAVFDVLGDGGPDYTLDRVVVCDGGGDDDPDCHPSLRVIVDGTVRTPRVLGPADAQGVRRLLRDASGAVVVDGVEPWRFRLQLPHAAFEGDAPVPVLQYGHGFLGSLNEANNGWLREMADRHGFAILSTSLQGMSGEDAAVWIAVLLSDGGRFVELIDKPFQGVANQLALQRLVKTDLADDDEPALRRADGALAWDPDTVWYYGNSQGGSVGTVMMAMSTDVTRGVLGVPGSGYPFLLHRSVVFTDAYATAISATYREPDVLTRFLALLGTAWDDFDPLTFAPLIVSDTLPGTPPHEVLLHVAKEDAQVLNEASFILGRAAGAVLMTPSVRPVFGLPSQTYPAQPGAAVVEVDFSVPDDPTPLTPPGPWPDLPSEGDTHGWLRKWLPAQDQMVHFLATGELIDVCEGAPCVTDGEP